MRFPQNFHASTSGLNTLVNLEQPSEQTVMDQAFCVNFEGSKQCTTTGSTGVLKGVFSPQELDQYALDFAKSLKSTPLEDNV